MSLTSPLIDQAIALKHPFPPLSSDNSLHCPDGLCRSSNPAAWEAVVMGKHRIKPNIVVRVLRLPDLDHCKLAVSGRG